MTTIQPPAKQMATRQKIRLTLLFFILLTFPITLNYFSVFLIIEGSAKGTIVFSFFFWSLWVVTSLLVGRAACGYICPLGAVQETKDRMGAKELKKLKHLKILKYVFAVAWVGAIVSLAALAGGYTTIDLLYNTDSGISVDRPEGWIIYFIVVLIVLLPVIFIGKRGFCHYFCPWGVLNTIGTKIGKFLRLPVLHLEAETDKCKKCHNCDKNCPMSLEVSKAVQSGSMYNQDCILCGTCVDNCPQNAISYSWERET